MEQFACLHSFFFFSRVSLTNIPAAVWHVSAALSRLDGRVDATFVAANRNP